MRTLLKLAVVLGVAGGLAAHAAVLFYVAGLFLAMARHDSPAEVRIVTFYQFWYWCRADPRYAHFLYPAMLKALLSHTILVCGVLWCLTRERRSLHGSARFARYAEIKHAGLFAAGGILIGKYRGRFMVLGGQQFVMVAAPTRSGKGVGVVVPNLLNFPDSVVVLDIKQENFGITAGFRANHGQEVFLFNPFAEDGRSHRYNPLSYISEDPYLRIGDILAIGTIIFPPEGKDGSGKDAFWFEQARNLFLGLVLLLCETPELPCTMGEVLRQASGYGQRLHKHLNAIIKARFNQERPLSAACVEALYRFLDNAEVTYAGILSTFNAALTNWANPVFDAATSDSDFSLTDIRRKRVSIYIGITPDHLPDAAALLNILFAQLVTLNMKELPQNNPELRYQCLLLMDEFTAIGKVNIIAKAVGFMAGYNLRLLPIIQSVAQLASVYGEQDARTFMTNHALQILYAPREQKDANEYSEMLGSFTEKNVSMSRPFGLLVKGGSRSDTISDQKRALLLPQEIKELGIDKEIVLMENCKPILADKIRYYADPVFKRRLGPPPVIPTLDFDTYAQTVEIARTFNSQFAEVTPVDLSGETVLENSSGEKETGEDFTM